MKLAAAFENDDPRPTLPECRHQVERIQQNSAFNATERERRLFAYVTDEAFSGRADRIKAYTIAVEVFGRGSTFDPQGDPIVRIAANRLRQSLERYYLLAGRSDLVLVTIPKGGYVPSCTYQAMEGRGGGDAIEADTSAPSLENTSSPPPSNDDVRHQLELILHSPEFPKVGRTAAFLSYIVGEVFAGREERIKGYSIAIEVFKRPASFTQDDPIVRIEAGRLRRALERYYLVAGQTDPVRIDVPKGGYVPIFTWNPNRPPAADLLPIEHKPEGQHHTRLRRNLLIVGAALAVLMLVAGAWWAGATFRREPVVPERPTLMVTPFEDLDGGEGAGIYSKGITEELLTALVRFKEVKVFGGETRSLSPQADAAEMEKQLGARYLLSGGVRTSINQIRVTAKLTDTTNGEVLWSQTYDNNLRANDLLSIQADVASKVATTVAQPYGVIAQAEAPKGPSDDLGAYECTSSFYTYRAELSTELHAKVRDCLEEAVARYPVYATAWAMLSIIYLDESRYLFNARADNETPVHRALRAARRAIQLDSGNVRGLQALMMALTFNQEFSEAMLVGEQALATNPNDTELLGEFGLRVAMGGDWRRGAVLLDRGIALSPGGGGYNHGTRALVAYFLGDYKTAITRIRQEDLERFPLFHAVAAIIYADAGMLEEARREGQAFMEMHPDFISNLKAELQMRFQRPEDQLRVAKGLRKAGVPIGKGFEAVLRQPAGAKPASRSLLYVTPEF